MFTGSRKYQKKAKKIQKLIGDKLFNGFSKKTIEWEYDASERMIEGTYQDIVTGISISGSAYLDRKGNTIEYDSLVLMDTDSNRSLDAGIYYNVDVDGTKGFKKHLKAANKPDSLKKIEALTTQAFSDNGRGLASFLDSLPGVEDPSSKFSTGVGVTLNSSNLPFTYV